MTDASTMRSIEHKARHNYDSRVKNFSNERIIARSNDAGEFIPRMDQDQRIYFYPKRSGSQARHKPLQPEKQPSSGQSSTFRKPKSQRSVD